jgi:hypothetical protein
MNETQRPEWLVKVQAEGTQLQLVQIDGQQYQYTIVKKGLASGLPYAVGYPADSALMISEDVPQIERLYILAHEVREKKRFGDLPEHERCKTSLQLELGDFQRDHPQEYEGYVLRRLAFFDALVKLYKNPDQQKAVSLDFQIGIQNARDYLESVSKQ